MPQFILNEKQQGCLKTLIEGLYLEEKADSMMHLASHFRDNTDWPTVEAETGEDLNAEPYRIFILLHMGPTAEGYMKLALWRRSLHEFTITLYSNENPDFSLHRYCEGELWDALDCLFSELKAKQDPQILEG